MYKKKFLQILKFKSNKKMTTKTDIIYSTINTKLIYEIIIYKNPKKVSSSIINLLLIKILIFISLFIKSNHYPYITLKTNQTGNLKIFSKSYEAYWPNEVWINDIIQTGVKNEYYINNSNDIIKLVWHSRRISISEYFTDCSNITEIDFSNFDASTLSQMISVFNGCKSLQRINFSNFDTSQIENMNSLFKDCLSLTSLDLSNFNISKVISMNSMFEGCSSLIYLNLSSFNTSFLNSVHNMFYNCLSLSSLIFPYFDVIKIREDYINALIECPNLTLINLKEAKTDNEEKIIKLLGYVPKDIIVCSNTLNLENIFSHIYIIKCMKNINVVTDTYICYTNDSNIYNNKHICDICDLNFHLIYDHLNIDSTINCYETMDNLCTNYIYYNLTSNFFHCTNKKECPDDYNKLIKEKKQCIDNCENDPIYKYEYNNICKNENVTEIINNKTKIINNIIQELINDYTDIDNGIDKKIYEKNLSIVLTSTLNQKNNEDKNNITINLSQCENILKNNYNISNNDSLYILEIISEEPGMKIPKIEYNIYYPLYNNSHLIKLDLSFCKDTKIEISMSVKINDNLDKYNPKSDYYNNICYKTTSESGTDISLKDRRNEFVNNNMSLCEENCDLINYNKSTEKVKCSCDIKLSIPSDYDIKFKKMIFLKILLI